MIAWWASVALALPEEYPSCAPVQVPGGTLRIEVPLDLRSAEDPAYWSDLVLLGPDEAVVPFPRIEGDPGDVEQMPLTDRPIDVLRVHPPPGLVAATAVVRRGGAVIGGPELVWQLSNTSRTDIAVPAA